MVTAFYINSITPIDPSITVGNTYIATTFHYGFLRDKQTYYFTSGDFDNTEIIQSYQISNPNVNYLVFLIPNKTDPRQGYYYIGNNVSGKNWTFRTSNLIYDVNILNYKGQWKDNENNKYNIAFSQYGTYKYTSNTEFIYYKYA